MNDGYNLTLDVYPVDGNESEVVSTIFGPLSEEFALLITINPATGDLGVVVGNSTPADEVPVSVPYVLRGVADAIEGLATSPDFWMSVGAQQFAAEQSYGA